MQPEVSFRILTSAMHAWGIHINLIKSIESGQSIWICCLDNRIPGIQPVLKLGPNQKKASQRMSVSWIPGKRCIQLKVNYGSAHEASHQSYTELCRYWQ
jgi:hypothetical protein